jgi:hypothetical protein
MVKPERVFRDRFKWRECPKCKHYIEPQKDGSHPMHGYKLVCPNCKAYIGWGGKIYSAHLETAVI